MQVLAEVSAIVALGGYDAWERFQAILSERFLKLPKGDDVGGGPLSLRFLVRLDWFLGDVHFKPTQV